MATTVTIPVIADAQLSSTNGGTNFGSTASFTLVTSSAISRAIMDFDLSSIPADAIIQTANLTLKTDSSTTATNTFTLAVRANAAGSTWTETTVTYSNAPAMVIVSGQGTVSGRYSTIAAPATIDIAPTINHLRANGGQGITLISADTASRVWASRNNTTLADRPTLTVTYEVPVVNADINFPAIPAGASLNVVEPVVSSTQHTHATVAAAALSASALMQPSLTTTIKQVNHTAAPMTSSVLMSPSVTNTTRQVSVGVAAMASTITAPNSAAVTTKSSSIPVAVFAASALMRPSTTSTTRNVNRAVAPMTSSSLMRPSVTSVVRNVGRTVAPMTASATSPNAAVIGRKTKTISAGAMGVSASGVNGSRVTSFTTIPITKDTWINQVSPSTNYGQEVTLSVKDTAWAFFDFSTDLGRENVHKAALTITPVHDTNAFGGANLFYRLYAITGPWTEDSVNFDNTPALAHVADIDGSLQTNSPITVDVTAALAQGVYGFALQNINQQQHTFSSREGTYPPTLNVTYEIAPIGSTVQAGPFATNAVGPQGVGTIRKDAENTVAPATASALSLDAQVETTTVPDVNIYAGTLDAALDMSGKYSVSAVMTTDVATAEGEIKVPEIYTEQNAVISASAATARARIIPVAEEQPVDTWSNRLSAQTDSNDVWLRLNETAGTTAVAAKGTNGTYVGGPVLGQFGLENRRYVDFDGNDDRIELPYRENLARNGAVEMVFRTTDADGTLMYGIGDAVTNTAVPGTYIGLGYQVITNVGLVNGKIRVNMMQFGGAGIPYFEGSKRVDDNQWHHIVVVWVNTQMRVYLDGKLHFQRHLLDSRSTIVGAPTSIGQDFDGDIMEFIFRAENTLGQHDIQQNYYAAFGIEPNFATPMGVIAAAGDNKGKGNQKRALALYYYNEHYSNMGPNLDFKDERYNWPGMRMFESSTTGITSDDHVPFTFGPYLAFPKSVQLDQSRSVDSYMGGQYYDEVTGELRYIDFMEDIDMSEYDLVFFVNVPLRHNPVYGEAAHASNLYDNMFKSLRQAQDTYGFSMWIPQPQVAADYGIISRVEEHGMMRESMVTNDQGNAAGLYDRRSFEIDPIYAEDSKLVDKSEVYGDMGRFYYDSHAINKARVTAYLPEFNDHGGYIIEDYFFSRPRDPYLPPLHGFKFKDINDRGLKIGDEVYYPNQDYFANAGTASGFFDRMKRMTVVSVPPAAVKAGTVILREQMNYWHGKQGELKEVANPWRDNAVTIAVQPGDNVGGRPIGGKVLVDFMNNLDGWQLFTRQIVPEGAEEGAVTEWDYLTARTSRVSVVARTGAQRTVGDGLTQSGGWGWDGGRGGSQVKASGGNVTGNSDVIIGVNEHERYDTEELPNVNLFDRGILWLSVRQEYIPGQITVRAQAITAEASAPQPFVGGEVEVVVTVEPMQARLVQPTPEGVNDPDAVIAPFPMRASARITQYTKYIRPAPFTVEAEVKEPDRFYVDTPESVTFWLYHTDPTLYVMEVK